MTVDFFSVILPTYNEVENLPLMVCLINRAFQKIPNSKYEIIVVDDGSTDGTQEAAIKLGEIYGTEHVVLHTRPRKLGLGTAYVFGLQFTSGDFVIIMDADLSHDPRYLVQFIEAQRSSNCDIVTGSRYCGPGGGVSGWGLLRKTISIVANFVTQVTLRPGVSDITGSYRLYKKAVLVDLVSKVQSKGFSFQMEIAVRARRQNFTFSEDKEILEEDVDIFQVAKLLSRKHWVTTFAQQYFDTPEIQSLRQQLADRETDVEELLLRKTLLECKSVNNGLKNKEMRDMCDLVSKHCLLMFDIFIGYRSLTLAHEYVGMLISNPKKFVKPFASNWRNIGKTLGISASHLNDIQQRSEVEPNVNISAMKIVFEIWRVNLQNKPFTIDVLWDVCGEIDEELQRRLYLILEKDED